MQRLPVIAAVVGGVCFLAAILIGLSLLTGGEGEPERVAAGSSMSNHVTAGEQIFTGIPQDGVALGRPDAPVTLVEYADVQCPYCADWSRETFPALVREYVRSGKVRIVFRGLAFLGPDSEKGLRAALAAGERDRLWNVVHGLYASQGEENAGWVTDDLLRQLGEGAGIDADAMLADSFSAPVDRELAAARTAAEAVGVPGTPFFEAGPTGGALEPLRVESLGAEPFREALDRLLAG